MTISHELIHYSQSRGLEQICFLGYDKEIETIAWIDDGINEYTIIDKEPNLSLISLTIFIIITIIIGIVLKHKYK